MAAAKQKAARSKKRTSSTARPKASAPSSVKKKSKAAKPRNRNTQRTVRTRSELRAAVETGIDRIIVKGPLADKLNRAMSIKSSALTSLGAKVGSEPVEGRAATVGALTAGMLTGIEIVVIIAALFIGLYLLLLIVRKYERVKFRLKFQDLESELELQKSKG